MMEGASAVFKGNDQFSLILCYVNMFCCFEFLYYVYIFLQNISVMNIIVPIFYRTFLLQYLQVKPLSFLMSYSSNQIWIKK